MQELVADPNRGQDAVGARVAAVKPIGSIRVPKAIACKRRVPKNRAMVPVPACIPGTARERVIGHQSLTETVELARLRRVRAFPDLQSVRHPVAIAVGEVGVGAVGDHLIVFAQPVAIAIGQVRLEGRANRLVGVHEDRKRVLRAAGVARPAGEDVAGVGDGCRYRRSSAVVDAASRDRSI